MHPIIPTICILFSSQAGAIDGRWVKCQLRQGTTTRSQSPDGFLVPKIPIHFTANVINGCIELIEFTDTADLEQRGPIMNYFRNVLSRHIALKNGLNITNAKFRFEFDSPDQRFSLYLLVQPDKDPLNNHRSSKGQEIIAKA